MSRAWHEQEEFWAALAPLLCARERLARAPADVDAIVALLVPAEAARVLDLCCGPGAHAVALARRGYRVTGVDRSPSLLARARAAAIEVGVAVEWVQEDMRRFVRPRKFDVALNLYTSLGYFEDEAENVEVARNVRESLVAGGVALFEMVGREVERALPRGIVEARLGGLRVTEERAPDADGRWLETTLRLVPDAGQGAARELRARHRLYSGAEIEALLREAGFAQVSSYGGFDGSPYDAGARRLVAVAART